MAAVRPGPDCAGTLRNRAADAPHRPATVRRRTAIGAGLALVLALGGEADAQTVAVPTFPVGQAVFSSWLQDVDVAAGTDGSFVVIWGEYSFTNFSGSADHAVTRRFSANGVPLGPPTKASTTAHVYNPVISADGRGGYLAAWEWVGRNEYRFFGQTLDATGAPTGRDFPADLDTGIVLTGTAVGTPAGPAFVWSERGVWVRLLDVDRTARGGDLRISSGSPLWNDVAATPEGGFVAVWSEFYSTPPGIWAQVFGPDGQQRVPRFFVSDGSGQIQPSGPQARSPSSAAGGPRRPRCSGRAALRPTAPRSGARSPSTRRARPTT
jgi:hypothetical protein